MILHQQHTNPDQSEKLIKAGLPISTADMYYRDGVFHQGKPRMDTMAVVAPIWSALAIRQLIPTYIGKDKTVKYDQYRLGWEETQQGVVVFYVDKILHTFTLVEFEHEDLLGAYIEMMCWLLENGYIEKGGES